MTIPFDVSHVYETTFSRLVRLTHSRFPKLPLSLAEDAVANVFLSLLEHPEAFTGAWHRGGEGDLFRLLRYASWCQLRGMWRKLCFRCEVLTASPPDCMNIETPESVMEAIQVWEQLHTLIESASQRFGGCRVLSLKKALVARLLQGGTDTQIARTYDIPREYLNRAKRWIQQHFTR